MKVSEVIVEGIWDTVKAVRSFKGTPGKETTAFTQAAKQAGVDLNPLTTKQDTQQSTTISGGTNQQRLPPQGAVYVVTAPNGEVYFKSYKDTWHVKGKAPDDYSPGGTKVTNPKDLVTLDALLPSAKLVYVKPDPTDKSGNSWIADPRKQRLVAKRQRAKK